MFWYIGNLAATILQVDKKVTSLAFLSRVCPQLVPSDHITAIANDVTPLPTMPELYYS